MTRPRRQPRIIRASRPTAGELAGVAQAAVEAYGALKPLWDQLVVAREGARELSYHGLVSWFSTQDVADAVCGAAIRSTSSSGLEVSAVFLDRAGALVRDAVGRPVGVRFRAAGIDAELAASFGQHNVILFS